MSTAMERRMVYGTKRWKYHRQIAMARARFLCEWCLEEGRHVGAALVHHIVSIRSGGKAFDQENLVAVCAACHITAHAAAEENPEVDPRWNRLVQELLN